MRRGRAVRPRVDRSAFGGFRFAPEVITVAVRRYLRYGLSYRDLEELPTERGIHVDHVTMYRWVQRFTPLFADAARPARRSSCRPTGVKKLGDQFGDPGWAFQDDQVAASVDDL